MKVLITGGTAGNSQALDRIMQNQGALKASQGDVACAMAFLVNPANFWITRQVNGFDAGLAEVNRW